LGGGAEATLRRCGSSSGTRGQRRGAAPRLNVSPEMTNALFRVSPQRAPPHSHHCTPVPLTAEAPGWRAPAHCVVEDTACTTVWWKTCLRAPQYRQDLKHIQPEIMRCLCLTASALTRSHHARVPPLPRRTRAVIQLNAAAPPHPLGCLTAWSGGVRAPPPSRTPRQGLTSLPFSAYKSFFEVHGSVVA
jgi:hypothetical protein